MIVSYVVEGVRRSLDLKPRKTVLGRAQECDLVIPDPRASRRHATLEPIGTQHLVADCGSANGTYLNGHRLGVGTQVLLREGDVIAIGGLRLTYGPALDDGPDEELLATPLASFPLVELATVAARIAKTADPPVPPKDQSLRTAVERALAAVAAALDAPSVAILLERGGGLEPAGTHGVERNDGSARAYACTSWAQRVGIIGFAAPDADSRPTSSTVVETCQVYGAVPFPSRGPIGVLVFLLKRGRMVERGHLARALNLADRFADAIAVGEKDANLTRFGFEERE